MSMKFIQWVIGYGAVCFSMALLFLLLRALTLKGDMGRGGDPGAKRRIVSS